MVKLNLPGRTPVFRKTSRTPRGAALAEMGIVVGLISVLSIGAVFAVGGETKDVFCTAAGTLSKANGRDGYCLGEMTAIDAVIEGPSFLDMMFKDHAFAMGQMGGGLSKERAGRLEGGISLITESHDGLKVAPCINGICAPTSADVSSLEFAEGDWSGFGYDIDLPAITEEVNASFDLTVSSLADPSLWYTWTIGVTRPATPPAVDAELNFGNLTLGAGASMNRTILEYFTGDEAVGGFTLTAVARGGTPIGVCRRVSDNYDPICTTPSDDGGSMELQTTIGSIGYQVANPAGVTAWDDHEDIIDITMASMVDPSVKRSWAVELTRPGLTPVLSSGLSFNDIVRVAGGGFPTEEMQSGKISGGNGTYHLIFDGKGEFETRSCYKSTDNSTYPNICSDWADVSTSGSYGYNQLLVGYGIRHKTLTVWDDINGTMEVTMVHDEDPDVKRTWSVNVSRPAQEAALESNIDFPTLNVPAGASLAREVFKSPQITKVVGGYGLAVDGKGIFDVRVCHRTGLYTDPICTAWGDTAEKEWTATSYNVIGFEMSPKVAPSIWEDYSSAVDVKLYNSMDETLGKSWEMAIIRPALEPEIDITVDFPTKAINPGITLAQEIHQIYTVNKLTGGKFTLDVDGQGIFNVRTCRVQGNRSDPVCAAWGDTSVNDYTNAWWKVGFDISPKATYSVWEDFEETVKVRIYHPQDHDLGYSWDMKVTRPARAPVFDHGIDFSDVSFTAGESPTKVVMSNTNVTSLNSTYQLEIDGKGIYDVRTCHVYTSGNPICQSWGDTAVSGNYSAVYKQVGFEFRPKVEPAVGAAISDSISVKAFHTAVPSKYDTWDVGVLRPAAE